MRSACHYINAGVNIAEQAADPNMVSAGMPVALSTRQVKAGSLVRRLRPTIAGTVTSLVEIWHLKLPF